MRLDLATVLLQWAAGGLAYLWVTSRRRVVGIGYGWLLRSSFAVIAAGGVWAGVADRDSGLGAAVRDWAGGAMVVLAVAALIVSVVKRHDGLSAPHSFPPWLDALAPIAGAVALVGAAFPMGGNEVLGIARLLVGAAFLGCITDAMLLGHWYLVQPGLARDPIRQLVDHALVLTPVEIVLMLIPTGMVQVLSGSIDDGWGGLIGWMWVLFALTTVGLLIASRRALREPYYSAVMATTGLLYLGILTAFGTDVMARAAFGT